MNVFAYGKKLLARGQRLAKEGKYENIAHEVFSESNHGHSGWTLSIQSLYEYPQNEAEFLLRNAFIALLNETLRGIRDVLYPNATVLDRPWLFEAAYLCLDILGEAAPDEFILWKDKDDVALKMGTISFHKKIHPKKPRVYNEIRHDGQDHLSIAENLNVLEVKLLGELLKSGCKEYLLSPFSVNPQMEIDMQECPVETRPRMRAYWEVLQSLRRVKKFKPG